VAEAANSSPIANWKISSPGEMIFSFVFGAWLVQI
jgi:hypothetical protein